MGNDFRGEIVSKKQQTADVMSQTWKSSDLATKTDMQLKYGFKPNISYSKLSLNCIVLTTAI